MGLPAVIQIIGVPVAYASGLKDAWRKTAEWAAWQLKARFGDVVQVEYYDLFDPGCPPVPEGAQLPLVLLESQVVSSGEKISIPLICKRLEALGIIAISR